MGLTANLVRIVLLLAAPALPATAADPVEAPQSGTISGVVTHAKTRKPLKDALVVLQCTCFAGARETKTDADGRYSFAGLPAGTFTIQVLVGQADVSKVVTMTAPARFRASFSLDPKNEFRRAIKVQSPRIRQRSAVGRSVNVEELRNVPAVAQSRDFTAVVESSGISLAGSTPAEGWDRPPTDREGYSHVVENAFLDVEDRPLSTFAADVDTASYANVRRFVTHGALPPPDAVRIEELVNYFPYAYEPPPRDRPVAVNWEIADCPWARGHLLARIGLQTRPIAAKHVARRNLVFLIDVSGSMNEPDKLPLLQRSMMLLVDQLRPDDTVSIVVYAGAAGVVLRPTSGRKKAQIRDAIAELEPGGSTNGAAGIRNAYALARRAFVRGGINRVILATDGDFNVGTTSDGELTRLIEKQRQSGVFLSVLGFGRGNLQDATMELLADKGNGNYAYIDTLHEARKVLVEQAGATLATVAKDVKLQVEFNPRTVAAYRLIGYENRKLADEDFDDDRKDAGEMGAGHSVTALYEIVPVGKRSPARKHAKLRYQGERRTTSAAGSDEWMTVKVRSKPADGDKSRLQEVVMRGKPFAFDDASADLRFAAAVAQYGMLLRKSEHTGKSSFADVLRHANAARGPDEGGHRSAFLDLVRATMRIDDRRE